MQMISFYYNPKFIYQNEELFIYTCNKIKLYTKSKEGELLQYLRMCSFKSFCKQEPFYLNHTKGYKKLLTYKLKKNKLAKSLSILRLPNLNKWNQIRSQIRKHL